MSKRKRPQQGQKPARQKPIRSPMRNEKRASDSATQKSGTTGGSPYWLYGSHAVFAALANPGRQCHRLVATPGDADALSAEAAKYGREVPVEKTDRREIERLLTPGAVHQGVALLAEPLEEVWLEDVFPRDDSRAIALVLDQVTDPRNVGAALRAAAAFGAGAIVMQRRHAPPETGALAKAASGALEVTPLVRVTNLARGLEDLKAAGFWCVGLDGKAETNIGEADISGRIALVLGSEGSGLRRLTLDHCDMVARIPITGKVESLNLATAAAVALYETARRT
ncbi:MAG: 23S rRNA (guanosine(2251)-2'-O)-methyltransferase RlmB [Rhodospirillales bacterium]|nr:23S rRNA (guanosine(2251)-2'-O)-methyltransferase RlmB [Rhodospirillales bacterium]